MSYVRLVKIAVVEHPVAPPGDPETYRYGKMNSDASLPVGDWLSGVLRLEPAVGARMVVDRDVRNGVVRDGRFTSSEVVRIEGDQVWTTNSVYRITKVVP